MYEVVDQALLERLLRAKLGDSGWEIRVAPGIRPNDLSAGVHHPLVGRLGFVLDKRDPDWRGFLDRWLDDREFDLVRRRPKFMPHVHFIGALRSMAAAHAWDLAELSDVARAFEEEALLTADEVLWLGMAGPNQYGTPAYELAMSRRRDRTPPIAARPGRSTDHESTVMADRPPMTRASLVDALRRVAQRHSWRRRDLADLGGFLFEQGVLTDAEYAWLVWAGPPHTAEPSEVASWRSFLEADEDDE